MGTSAVQVRGGAQLVANESSHNRTIRQHTQTAMCHDLLVSCPAFTMGGELHQFPPVLLKRSAPNWWEPDEEATVGTVGDTANNMNDLNAVLAVANSTTGVVQAQAEWLGTAVPFFNLGLQAVQYGAQAYQEATEGCSEKTFVFCNRPASARDRISTWPDFMPHTIALETLIYLELVAQRISGETWKQYVQKSQNIACLKSAMRKIQWDCRRAQTHLLSGTSLYSIDDFKKMKWHCGLTPSPAGHDMRNCRAVNYLKADMCEGMGESCGICNGVLEDLPPHDVTGVRRTLDTCELEALKTELLEIAEGKSNYNDARTNFDAEDMNADGPSANQVARINQKWADVETWIAEQNNEHLEALHGCMRMNSLSDGGTGSDRTYFEQCFRKMCNVPKDAEVQAREGVDEYSMFHSSHTVGSFGVKSTALWKSLFDGSCASMS